MTYTQQVSITLLSMLGSGVVSALIVAYFAGRRDRIEYRRKKLEELHELLRVDHVQFFDWWIQYMAVFEGSISPGEVSRKSVSITHGMERKTQVEILASLYAPNVSDALATYFCRKQDFVKSINKMIKTMKRESLQSIPLNAFHVSREAYEAAQREILSAVVAEARKL